MDIMTKQRTHSTRTNPAKVGNSKASVAPKNRRTVVTKFGNVTVSAQKPTPETVKANVELSTAALARVVDRLVKGGITLPRKKGVPQYSLDRDNPNIVIRKLDGKISRGEFADGKFKEFA